MKPENLIQIRRNVLTFSVIVLLLSVAIGSSAWTFLGEGMRRTRDEAGLAVRANDSLMTVIDSMSKTNRASQNLVAIVEAMTRAHETIVPLEGQYINAYNTAKISSDGLFPVPGITKPALSGIDLALYEAFAGLMGSLGEYGQLMIDMNSSPQTLQGELSKCRDDLRRRDDEIAQLKAKAGSGSGTAAKPTGTGASQPQSAAPCAIACADCERVAKVKDEIDVMASDLVKFVKPNYKGKNNKLSHEVKYPSGMSTAEKLTWIDSQFRDLILNLNKKFDREIK